MAILVIGIFLTSLVASIILIKSGLASCNKKEKLIFTGAVSFALFSF
jgi:hypothetical protein